jgi:hypothetical protein
MMTNQPAALAVAAQNGAKRLGCLAAVRESEVPHLRHILPPNIEVRRSELSDDELIRQRYRPFFITYSAFSWPCQGGLHDCICQA